MQTGGIKALGTYLYKICLRLGIDFLERQTSELKAGVALINQLSKPHGRLLVRGSLHFTMRHLQRLLNSQELEE